MSKNIYKIVLTVSALLFIASSCIKIPPQNTPSNEHVNYYFEGGSDMPSLFDLTVTYVNAQNKTVQERIKTLPWTKNFQIKAPFEANMSVDFAAKGTVPDKETYNIGFTGGVELGNKSRAATTNMFSGSRQTPEAENVVKFSITLPQGVKAEDIDISIPSLKYDKHFAFSYTADDAVAGAYARLWRRINKKWIDDIEFFHAGMTPTTGYLPKNTLGYTDGCGNERRFAFGSAIWATWTDSYNPNGRIHDFSQSKDHIYITWEELLTTVDFGSSVYFHNINEAKYGKADEEQITLGFADDRAKTIQKLDRKMKILAVPDGNRAYLDAAMADPQIKFIRTDASLAGEFVPPKIYLNSVGAIDKIWISSGFTDDTDAKLRELELQSANPNPYWVTHTTHRTSTKILDMMEQINDLYGKDGADNLWVASFDEVYEYRAMRAGAKINKRVDGDKLIVEITLPQLTDFYYRDLSFLISGINTQCAITPLTSNICGLSRGVKDEKTLLNLNFNPQLIKVAQKYTDKFIISRTESDKDDAMYFISQLRPELAAPMSKKIDAPLSLGAIKINGGSSLTFTRSVTVEPQIYGTPDQMRVSEQSDMLNAQWQPYAPSFDYQLSDGFGTKTMYVQIKNSLATSSVVSQTINYTETITSGSIPKGEKLNAYIQMFDGYHATFKKSVGAK